MAAGRRDTLVQFQRAVRATDEYGQAVPASWAVLCSEWVAVLWGRGAERREAAATQLVQSATFQALAHPVTLGVLPTDRIVMDGVAWNIGGIAPMAGGLIEFTAVRGEAV